MRLFAAVIPPPAAVDHLAEQVRVAEQVPVAQDAQLTWTESTAWHVTLAFYGNVEDARTAELTDRLTRAANRQPPMELRLSGAGRFGTAVLWIGVQGEVERLGRLGLATVAAGRRMGLGRDEKRPFRPHVTVARSRHRQDLRPYVSALAGYDGPIWNATRLALVRSHLGAGPGGRAKYELLTDFPLGGGQGRMPVRSPRPR